MAPPSPLNQNTYPWTVAKINHLDMKVDETVEEATVNEVVEEAMVNEAVEEVTLDVMVEEIPVKRWGCRHIRYMVLILTGVEGVSISSKRRCPGRLFGGELCGMVVSI